MNNISITCAFLMQQLSFILQLHKISHNYLILSPIAMILVLVESKPQDIYLLLLALFEIQVNSLENDQYFFCVYFIWIQLSFMPQRHKITHNFLFCSNCNDLGAVCKQTLISLVNKP